MGSGELQVEGGSSKLLEAAFDYNVRAWKPAVEYVSGDSLSTLTITQPSRASASNAVNRWNLKLNDVSPMEVTARLGAGEATLKLGSLKLRGLDLNVGVGEVEVDLRGTPTESYDVQIRGGVGSATVYLPASVVISATAQGGIGDINVRGLERRDGRWVNARQEASPVTIRVDVRGGVGEIRLVAE
jgi:hypothetical protein